MAGEWARSPLRDLIEFTRDGEWGTDRPTADSLEMLVVRGTDFDRLRVGELAQIPRRHIRRGAAERKQLRAGDVLIETAGGTKDQSTGRTAFVKQSHIERAGLPITCASFARFLRFDSAKVDSGFMYWWLQSLHRSGEMETHQVQHTGVARFQFTKFAESTEALLPSLPEQRAIAHILGTLDDKIELNRRMNETLEAMARALFKSWFVDFDSVRAKAEGRDPGLPKHLADLFPDSFEHSELGEIPKGWATGIFDHLADVSSGKRPEVRHSEASAEANVPLWGGNGPMAFVPRALIEHPILLTGRVGTLGVVFRITTPCWPSDNTLIVRTKNEAAFEYLFFQLQQIDFTSLNRGSTQPLLTQTDLKVQPLVLPPFELLAHFHAATRDLYCRVDESHAESRTLAALRDTLLPKLISGELRVKDAERFAAGVGA